MPSMVNYLGLTMPKEIEEGLDGKAFIRR